MNRHTPMTKADDVRETPAWLFEQRVRDATGGRGFTLDACATQANAKAVTWYTQQGLYLLDTGPELDIRCIGEGDGLTGPWGGRVWVNPPFTELWDWVQKCWRECDRGDVELIDFLMPSTRCEQKGWQAWVEPFRDGRAELVPGWRLTTTFLPGRPDFLKDGKPIMSEPKVSKRTGKLLKPSKSTPKFGIVMLTWTRQVDGTPAAR
jgi:hypothetical protein